MGFVVGQAVTWRHYSRGGYGYVCDTPAVVRKINAKTVRISALTASGLMKSVDVKPESLQGRKDRYGFDMYGECYCSWSSAIHGSKCPEHGEVIHLMFRKRCNNE